MKNSMDNRTEMVRRSLIRFIVGAGIKTGEKLPPQTKLREQLGVGAATVTRAINAFAEEGILKIKPNSGVFLAAKDLSGYIGHRIGKIDFRIFNYPSGASIQQCLRSEFCDHACQEIPFISSVENSPYRDSLNLYSGLKRSVEQKLVDGLISTVSFDDEAIDFLQTAKIPVCSLATAAYPYGATVGYENFLDRAFQLALERGFRKPGALAFDWPHPGALKDNYAKFFPDTANRYCRSIFFAKSFNNEQFKQTVVEAIESMWTNPENERPDCLIIPDDMIASVAYMYLRRKTEKLPHFIYECCTQLPFFIPPEVIGDYFLLDHRKLARAAVELMIEMVDGKKSMDEKIRLKVELITKEEQQK